MIVVFGSINIDLVFRLPSLPAAGETVLGDSYAVVPGGKGANQAVAAARLIGYSAMVGAVGGGGLGDLGIRYGYQRFMPEVMLTVVLVLIALVQGVQTLGDTIARRLDKRSRHS